MKALPVFLSWNFNIGINHRFSYDVCRLAWNIPFIGDVAKVIPRINHSGLICRMAPWRFPHSTPHHSYSIVKGKFFFWLNHHHHHHHHNHHHHHHHHGKKWQRFKFNVLVFFWQPLTWNLIFICMQIWLFKQKYCTIVYFEIQDSEKYS